MSSTLKICPICQTSHPATAMVCRMCGASLAKVEAAVRITRTKDEDETSYDFRYGENDLIEQPLSRRGQTCFTIVITAVVAFLLGGVFVVAAPSLLNRTGAPQPATMIPLPTSSPAPTVTIGAPTATASFTPLPTSTPAPTSTPEPCIQEISAGDSLYGALNRCGYITDDILPTVMALNGISDAASLQIGQKIVIPWPTEPGAEQPTAAALASTQADGSSSDGTSDDSNVMQLDESIDAFAPTAVPTLPAGVMWHEIQPNQNLASVSQEYGINMKILSELNPEMDFSQCDFGSAFGGPSCNVIVSIGQQIRVPAPTPLPTLSPTPDPNATATPTATPTYNEPFAVSPSDNQFFGRDELITLRWVPSGVLAPDEYYRIDVEDTTSGQAYTAYVRDIFFVMPLDWRGTLKPRHEFTWTVGVVSDSDRSRLHFTTQPRVFAWQGLVDAESEKKTK